MEDEEEKERLLRRLRHFHRFRRYLRHAAAQHERAIVLRLSCVRAEAGVLFNRTRVARVELTNAISLGLALANNGNFLKRLSRVAKIRYT